MVKEVSEAEFIVVKQRSWQRFGFVTPFRAQTPGKVDVVHASEIWGRFYYPLLMYRYLPIVRAQGAGAEASQVWTDTRWGFHKRADRDRFVTLFKPLGARAR